VAAATACLLSLPAAVRADPVVGQVDTFEDGTTQNWAVGLGPGGGVHPAPPTNVPDGGPAGPGDNYLLLTAVGGTGAGSRLSVINLLGQWSGNYLSSGVSAIQMDLNNLGETDLSLRLMFEDPVPNPPANVAISTEAVLLPAGGGWTQVLFPIAPGNLTAVLGSVNGALSNTTGIRIFHSPTVEPSGPPVVARLGVDNIRAAVIPEPGTLALAGMGLLPLAGAVVRRKRRKA
jgi:hypothetical protein